MQRRHHYEQAFEGFLRARRIPYVAVDEARKSLLPGGGHGPDGATALKSFDLLIYGQGANLLVEVKGRRLGAVRRRDATLFSPPHRRLENWVTLEDVQSLERWETLFGPGFEAAFVFIYWCEESPPDGLFEEIFEHAGRWYALKTVRVRDYHGAMRVRSPRWKTVDLGTASFASLAAPLLVGPGGTPPSPLLDRWA